MRITIYTKIFIVVLAGMGLYFYKISAAEDRKITAVYVEAWQDYRNIKLSEKGVDIAFIAFAKINGTDLYFHEDSTTNNQIKENIKQLKAANPKTQMVLAVGGYGADGFSDASLEGNRYLFTESIINLVRSWIWTAWISTGSIRRSMPGIRRKRARRIRRISPV